MDFERIALLLAIVHDSMNVPGTDQIRAKALEELALRNVAALIPSPSPTEEQKELEFGARRQ